MQSFLEVSALPGISGDPALDDCISGLMTRCSPLVILSPCAADREKGKKNKNVNERISPTAQTLCC